MNKQMYNRGSKSISDIAAPASWPENSKTEPQPGNPFGFGLPPKPPKKVN